MNARLFSNAKQILRYIEEFCYVYIEPELLLETLRQQRNTRTLLRAVGKQSDYTYIKRIDLLA